MEIADSCTMQKNEYTYYTSAMSFFMDRSLRGEVMSLDSINGNQIVTGCDTLERIDK